MTTLLHDLYEHNNDTSLLLVQHYPKTDLMKQEIGQPLFTHAVTGHANHRVLQAMLDKGVDINAQNDVGMTALMYATLDRDVATVQLLLAHHANVTLKDDLGNTALTFVKRGSSPSYKDWHPSSKDRQIARLLVQAGAY